MNEEKTLDSAPNGNGAQSSSSKVGGDIYVQDASKSFGVTKALNGVNFKANFGEIHAIVVVMDVVRAHWQRLFQEFYLWTKERSLLWGIHPIPQLKLKELVSQQFFKK